MLSVRGTIMPRMLSIWEPEQRLSRWAGARMEPPTLGWPPGGVRIEPGWITERPVLPGDWE